VNGSFSNPVDLGYRRAHQLSMFHRIRGVEIVLRC
jgi:hypothetical protein